MKNFKIVALALTAILSLSSCSKDDGNPIVNEEEVITTVTTTLVNGNQTVVLTSTDSDGNGSSDPVISVSGSLRPNVTYTGTVHFLNELKNPAEDITSEVVEEADDHQVFFSTQSAIGTITYKDTDANGKPIGLAFELQTGNVGTGNLTVTLKHLPNKSASGVADGDITNAGGATDAEVTYPVTIAD